MGGCLDDKNIKPTIAVITAVIVLSAIVMCFFIPVERIITKLAGIFLLLVGCKLIKTGITWTFVLGGVIALLIGIIIAVI